MRYQDTHEPLAYFGAIINRYFDIANPEASQSDRVAKIIKLATPQCTRAMEGQKFATVKEFLDAAPSIDERVHKEQSYRKPPPPHRLTSTRMGYTGKDPFAHVMAIHPHRKESEPKENKGKQPKQEKWQKNSDGKPRSDSHRSKRDGKHRKPSHNAETVAKPAVPAPKAYTSAKVADKSTTPQHYRCFKCDKEGHRIADCPENKQSKN